MNYIFKRIKSHLPSTSGQEALNDLLYILSVRGINFDFKKIKDASGEYYFAESDNIANKSIVATGKTLAELDANIKDAIFTIYQVPAYYCRPDLIKSPDFVVQNHSVGLKYATA